MTAPQRTMTFSPDGDVEGCPLSRAELDEASRLIAVIEARRVNNREGSQPRRVRGLRIEPMGHDVVVITLYMDQFGSFVSDPVARHLATNSEEQYALAGGRVVRRVLPPLQADEVDDSVLASESAS